jgi:hypothetical protein
VTKPAKARSWPVRANGLLLILQAAGLAGIGFYNVSQIDWQQVQYDLSLLPETAQLPETVDLPETIELPEMVEAAEQAIVAILLLGPPAILAVLAALGILFMFRVGWLLAMIAQGLTLLACLLLYTTWEPTFVYPAMLYCVVMVLYLNSSDVRAAFHIRRRIETRGNT